MADSAGLDHVSGLLSVDWDDVQQSIRTILATPIGSRVMRRDFGSAVPDMVDRKMVSRNILAVYVAIAEALDRWEPRFRLNRCSVDSAAVTGRIELSLYGTYFPRGHLGDYSVAQDATTRVVAGRLI